MIYQTFSPYSGKLIQTFAELTTEQTQAKLAPPMSKAARSAWSLAFSHGTSRFTSSHASPGRI
jgi:hypothetical protein